MPAGAPPAAAAAGALAAVEAGFLGLGFGGCAPSGKGFFRGRPRFRGVGAGCCEAPGAPGVPEPAAFAGPCC